MTQEIGRISRPSADQYQGVRKLLLVPLVYGPRAGTEEGMEILQRYWDQMRSQVASLESALGTLAHIYHESLTQGGDEGLRQLEGADQRSHGFVQAKCQAGSVLEPTEDPVLLAETLDLQRCLMLPFVSENVSRRIQEWFSESNRKRYEHISSQIDSTLGEKEMGLLLISERHQVQFPSDIEVFYVSPPALDEFRRWIQEWAQAQRQAVAAEAAGDEEALQEVDGEPAPDEEDRETE